MFRKKFKKTVEYIKKIKVSQWLVNLAFKEFRNVIYKYLAVTYQVDLLGPDNQGGFFSVDESLFGHRKNSQIRIIGIIETSSKNFRFEGSILRNGETLKKFITKLVKKSNTIISDMWPGYEFLDNIHSGYRHIKCNHGRGQFGLGMQSTSHIEAIWGILKNKR